MVVLLVLAALILSGCAGTAPTLRAAEVSTAVPTTTAPTTTAPTTTAATTSGPAEVEKPPNIVFILMDDASMNLLDYMPQAQKLQAAGTTFSNYYVTNSLCCPSRASILTGRYPHNTEVFTNEEPDGGYFLFHNRDEEVDTFATDLHAAGYRTALMGKYLNGYQVGTKSRPGPVPPGWDDWAVGGKYAYNGFDYQLNENGQVRRYGNAPKDYLTDVLTVRGTEFIKDAVARKKPFLLELATYAPHAPYTPAPRDRKRFAGLKAPRSPAYDAAVTNAPSWLAAKKPLSKKAQKVMDRKFRKRVQSVQAIDDMIARVKAQLVTEGVADDTYIVLSSDNGFHLGEHRLKAGKTTAFDTDIHAPLVVTGPGVPAGHAVDEIAANIDLRSTFAALAGAPARATVDGRDLSGLIHGGPAAGGRDALLIEHHGQADNAADPDRQRASSGHPPTYRALRGAGWLYVEYANGQREYYDTVADPDELNNVVSTLPVERIAQLHQTLTDTGSCAGVTGCAQAERMLP